MSSVPIYQIRLENRTTFLSGYLIIRAVENYQIYAAAQHAGVFDRLVVYDHSLIIPSITIALNDEFVLCIPPHIFTRLKMNGY